MAEHQTESNFIQHVPCDSCGSTDANSLYDDGHQYCFGCQTYVKGDGDDTDVATKSKEPLEKDLLSGKPQELGKRGIDLNTCRKWGYHVGKDKAGRTVQIANYVNKDRRVVAQKLRYADKTFKFIGKPKEALLFGQHLWKEGGRKIIIVEGEIDALSVSQAFNHTGIAVVSIQNGAQAAKKSIQKEFDWVNSFSQVILAFDNDEPGLKAMRECAMLFSPGKALLCYWEGGKDANEVLFNEGYGSVVRNLNESREYRPDEIVSSKKITKEQLTKKVRKGIPYPYPKLQAMTYGLKAGELNIWTAGSGIGKSTVLREVAYHIVKEHKQKVGMIFLEENIQKTAQAFIALDNDVPLGSFRYDPSMVSEENFNKSYALFFESGMVEFYNHFGSMDVERLLERIRYMVVGLGINYIFLDHISIVVSGSKIDDERKALDVLMTELRSLVEETQCHISAIVHLKRKGGDKSFNEGAQVSLTDLRGSGGLEQLSDAVIALERDQQSEENGDNSKIRILKNREVGAVGQADSLFYSKDTGRLKAIESQVPTKGKNKKSDAPVNDDF